MDDRVAITIDQGVAHVRMTRSDKANALDDAMFDALVAAGEQMKKARNVRAVVLSGDGKAFCGGLDLTSFGEMATGERSGASLAAATRNARGANRAQQAVLVWREVPTPVVAAVHGAALGGGFQLMLGADLRFVAPDTKLSVFEINWGLVPDMGGVTLLRGLVGDEIARDLTYTGRVFNGEEAVTLGLASRVSADPCANALAYAGELSAKNPDALRAAKRLFNLAAPANEATVLLAETQEQAALIGSANQREAARARLEKRPAVFED